MGKGSFIPSINVGDDQSVWSTRSDPPDPIFAAIDERHEIVQRFWTLHRGTLRVDFNLIDWDSYHAAFRAWQDADNMLVDTVPTTSQGLKALDSYLHCECLEAIGGSIHRPLVIDGNDSGLKYGGRGIGDDGDDDARDWLIAMRASGDQRAVSKRLVA
jgi:hypothetical protein